MPTDIAMLAQQFIFCTHFGESISSSANTTSGSHQATVSARTAEKRAEVKKTVIEDLPPLTQAVARLIERASEQTTPNPESQSEVEPTGER
jgi:hypothetical protein